MGITQIIDPFYERIQAKFGSTPRAGQIGWIPVPFLWGIPKIAEVERESPSDHFSSRFVFRQMNNSHFKKRNRLPIKLLGLRETEELVVTKCKCRPAIVLRPDQTAFSDLSTLLKQKGKKHLEDDLVGVIPLYSVQNEDSETGFPPIFVSRVKALMYNQFFYCPREGSELVCDSIARLDQFFFLRAIRPTLQPTRTVLSQESLTTLLTQISLLFGLVFSEKEFNNFEALRSLASETLPDEAKIKN